MSQQPVPPSQLTQEPPKEKRYFLTFGRVLAYLAYAYLVVVEIILGLGFVLQLFGASEDAGFVRWVYRSMENAMQPFRGIFPDVELATRASGPSAVLDTSVLFAMLVYAILAWAVHLAIYWFTGKLKTLERERTDALNRQAYLAAAQAPQPRQARAPYVDPGHQGQYPQQYPPGGQG